GCGEVRSDLAPARQVRHLSRREVRWRKVRGRRHRTAACHRISVTEFGGNEYGVAGVGFHRVMTGVIDDDRVVGVSEGPLMQFGCSAPSVRTSTMAASIPSMTASTGWSKLRQMVESVTVPDASTAATLSSNGISRAPVNTPRRATRTMGAIHVTSTRRDPNWFRYRSYTW